MSKNAIISILALALLLTMAGVDPLRALIGSLFGIAALGCMIGAGLDWLIECCPSSSPIANTLMGLLFASLTATAFII